MTVRIDGACWDIAAPVRIWQKYDTDTVANIRASHRQGFRARQREGEFFYTHPLCPGIAFATRGEALRGALRALAGMGAS